MPKSVQKSRLLFFDVLRIIAITSVVFVHVIRWRGFTFLTSNSMPFGLFFLGIGITSVSIFIFISGAVLEFTHNKIENITDLLKFYYGRIIRIYPAYWISMILGALIAPSLLIISVWNLIVQVGGFMSLAGIETGLLNPMGRFIGLIFILYLAFPFISSSMKKYPIQTMSLLTLITFGSRYIFYITGYGDLEVIRWYPECNLFMFGLGIVLVQYQAFPKVTHNNAIISFGANLSFYVFLISSFFYQLAITNLLLFIAAVLVTSTLLMWLDREIQVRIAKRIGS